MRVVVNMCGSRYHVQAYKQMPNDPYPQWHTLRSFVNQGDAFLFREMINSYRFERMSIDGYIKSYRPGTVVERIDTGNLSPKLRVSKDQLQS